MDDDLAFAWPSWKFGMKRGDLFTKLHDQYNTFSSTIQDPEAFHHDVFEIANEAQTEADFHRLLADRKQQRVDELNECLESASLEIIANPKLIGTEQWSYALQLFRSRSLDSLVRYFASYLPEGYLDRHSFHDDAASTVSSFTDRGSVQSESTSLSSVDDADDYDAFVFADENEDDMNYVAAAAAVQREPLRRITTSFKTSLVSHDLPPSPRSITSDEHEHNDKSLPSSPTDDGDHHDYHIRRFTPARSMSFSGSESDTFSRDAPLTDDDAASTTTEPESAATSVSDPDDHIDAHHNKQTLDMDQDLDDDYEDFATAQHPMDMFDPIDTVLDSVESDTPTPRAEPTSSTLSYLDIPATPSLRRRPSPLRDARTYHNNRRSPEEASSRISKPLPDTARTRATRGRRRALD